MLIQATLFLCRGIMNWKKIGIGLLFPPAWLKLIIAMLFLASVITITTGVDITKTIMCAMVIAYGLVVFITTCIKQIPQKHKEVKTHLLQLLLMCYLLLLTLFLQYYIIPIGSVFLQFIIHSLV